MTEYTIPGGYQPHLNPALTACGFGNGEARIKDISVGNQWSGMNVTYGPYAHARWRDSQWMGIRDFFPRTEDHPAAFRFLNVVDGRQEFHPECDENSSQILACTDGSIWSCKGGVFYRDGLALNVAGELQGDLSGQVLSNDGLFFSAEVMTPDTSVDQGLRTVVFNKHKTEMFRIGYKAMNAQVFSKGGYPYLFVTEGDQAIIYGASGRSVVASDIPCYRGSLFTVDDVLWALTISTLNGVSVGFARPWGDNKGIRVNMWGGLAVAGGNDATRKMGFAAYHQDHGELTIRTDISYDNVRKLITEEPDYTVGQPPVVIPPPTVTTVDSKVATQPMFYANGDMKLTVRVPNGGLSTPKVGDVIRIVK